MLIGYARTSTVEQVAGLAGHQAVLVHDGDRVLAETDGGTGAVLRRYVYGPGTDEPLLWYEGPGTTDRRWLHADERGSIVAVTNAAGASIATNAYDEYGIPGANNVGLFQYTGQKYIAALGLYDYKTRMYSPTLGRFLQTDPIGYADGLNWYAYAGNDPVNNIDPTGLFLCLRILQFCSPGTPGSSLPTQPNPVSPPALSGTMEPDIVVTARRPNETALANLAELDFWFGTPQNDDTGEDIVVTARRPSIILIKDTQPKKFDPNSHGVCEIARATCESNAGRLYDLNPRAGQQRYFQCQVAHRDCAKAENEYKRSPDTFGIIRFPGAGTVYFIPYIPPYFRRD